ncbi:uncharacterized protein LOC119461334 isoform X2 [Dermacentor silvarum]|uniref:uncharacterized protein LOC119461334 isoform X2 n=1 Tax=Dermacentor silvarum TaxID=543639 RepID=UPI00189AD816|nr:uncharacterized protein LOC119461334 isoform X2 [Dermacentor silvarum]
MAVNASVSWSLFYVSAVDSAAEKRARAAATKRQRRQADPELRAREAERKRQRRREAANDATRARTAEAARQRRQADPELRAREAEKRRKHRQEATDAMKAREAESKRKRRAADLEAARQRERESQRKRRAADPEAARQREAEYQRKRRAADPEAVRQRERESQRKRRAADLEAARQRERESQRKRRAADLEAARQRERESQRKRRAADPEAARQRESAAKAASRLKQLLRPGKDGADARFKRDFLDMSFGQSCSVCDRLWFDNNVTKIGSIQNEQYRNAAIGVLQQQFGNITEADGSNVISNYAEYTTSQTKPTPAATLGASTIEASQHSQPVVPCHCTYSQAVSTVGTQTGVAADHSPRVLHSVGTQTVPKQCTISVQTSQHLHKGVEFFENARCSTPIPYVEEVEREFQEAAGDETNS